MTDPRERVSTRYLLGMLAPKGVLATEPGRHDDGGTVGEDAAGLHGKAGGKGGRKTAKGTGGERLS